MADLAFGVRRRATGLTKWPVRNRQRVVTFAVTIVMKRHDPAFVAALRYDDDVSSDFALYTKDILMN